MVSLEDEKFWSYAFKVKACWNLGASALFFFGPIVSTRLREFAGVTSPLAFMYSQAFLVHSALLGVGYWIVGRDTRRNHLIVWAGVIAKIAFISILVYNWAALSTISFDKLGPALVDFVFLIVFVAFLRRARRYARSEGSEGSEGSDDGRLERR